MQRKLMLIFILVCAITAPGQTTNPLLYAGSDLGAKINAAAADCVPGQSCLIVLPSSIAAQTFTSTISLTDNVTLQCAAPMGMSARESGSDTPMNLNYAGTGTAVALAGRSSRFLNCGLRLSGSTAIGVKVTGDGAWVDKDYIAGGGTGTTLIQITGGSGWVEDARVMHTKLFNFIGNGIGIDHANDTQITDDVAYGQIGNTTGHTIVLDTQANGTTISRLKGGDSGAHGLTIQNKLNGNAPTWIFVDDFEADCSSGGDAWIFDSSLGTAQLGFVASNSWAAGAGTNCSGKVISSNAAGIHISGGRGITFIGTRVRANAGDGVLIDNSNVANVKIIGNQINGNNWNPSGPNGAYSGIRVSAAISDLLISGNTFDNAIEGTAGRQQYGIALNVTGTMQVVTANTCGTSTIACFNSFPSDVQSASNSSPDASGVPPVAFNGLPVKGIRFSPRADSTDVELYGTNAAKSVAQWSITRAGIASFSALNIGTNLVLPSNLTGPHGNSTRVQLSDGTGTSGNLAKFAADGSVTDGMAADSIATTNSPTVGHAACIKRAGPPVVIGYCSTVVDSRGNCTCN
jgi:hypothetical protein